MLLEIELEKVGEVAVIGELIPTMKVWAKVDGILGVMPHEDHRRGHDVCTVTIIGFPGVVVAMESAESLAERVNSCYKALGATDGAFVRTRADAGKPLIFAAKGGPAVVQ